MVDATTKQLAANKIGWIIAMIGSGAWLTGIHTALTVVIAALSVVFLVYKIYEKHLQVKELKRKQQANGIQKEETE